MASDTETMQAMSYASYGGLEVLGRGDQPVPKVGPGSVLIRVKAAGVNPVDWKIREGLLGTHEAPPVPMGREASGIVTAVGDGVEQFAVGDNLIASE